MTEVPAFPLSIAHLPGDDVALRIFEDRYLAMVDRLEAGRSTDAPALLATMLIERGSEVGGGEVRCEWGVMVNVMHIERGPGWCHLVGRATQSIVVRAWLEDDPYPRAVVEAQSEHAMSTRERFDVASALTLLAGRVVRLAGSIGVRGAESTLGRLSVVAEGRWWDDSVTDDELWRAFWSVCRVVPCGPLDRYNLLGPGPLPERLRRALEVVDHVDEVAAFRTFD